MKKETKLKTLKDIELSTDFGDCGDGGIIVISNDLRESARVWIKELEKPDYDELPKDFFHNTNPDHYYDIREWIKHFFNLEDDK